MAGIVQEGYGRVTLKKPTEARIAGRTHLWCPTCKKWFDISEQELRERFIDHACFDLERLGEEVKPDDITTGPQYRKDQKGG